MAKSSNQPTQIITCGCGDTDAFVADAIPLILPDQPIPPIYHNTLNLTNPIHIQMINALEKDERKYALLFTETKVYDLLKGVQIA